MELATQAPAPLLEVEGVTVRFGGITALNDLSFSVKPQQICGIIGPNGAGKTTLFNCLSRFCEPVAGEIRFAGQSLNRMAPHHVVSLGIGRTFQNVALFRSMSVIDNVLTGTYSNTSSGFVRNILQSAKTRGEEALARDRCTQLLKALDLNTYAERIVAELPFGVQKRVELARAMAARPRLLLLDEPAAGLNHEELESLKATILRLREESGLTIMLVEHHVDMVMSLSEHLIVINFGRKITEGTPREIQEHPEVISAYLGTA